MDKVTCLDTCPQPRTGMLTSMCLYDCKYKIIFYVFLYVGHTYLYDMTAHIVRIVQTNQIKFDIYKIALR